MKTLIDLSIVWSPATKTWHSTASERILYAYQQAGFAPVLSALLEDSRRDYQQFGSKIKGMKARMESRAWRARHNKHETLAVLFRHPNNEFIRKFLPFYLTTGKPIYLYCLGVDKPITLKAPAALTGEDVDITAVYRWLQPNFEDVLLAAQADHLNRELCTEEQTRTNATIEAILGLEPTARGPLTRGVQLRTQLPSLTAMLDTVCELAPLYDLDIPSISFSLYSDETSAHISTIDRNHRPDSMVRSTRLRSILLENPALVELVYAQISWYQRAGIEPDYRWADFQEPRRYDSTSDSLLPDPDDEVEITRLLPSELATLGISGRLTKYELVW